VLFVQHPKLKTQFLNSVAQRDLINARLVTGSKFEMDRAVCAYREISRRSYYAAAVQSFNGNGLAGICYRVIDGDIDGLIVP
jgi:hypothetical protein